MSTTTLRHGEPLPHGELLPRPPGGQALGAVLSIAVHAALLLALLGVVHWRTHSSDVVSAELWAAIPEVAAPAGAPTPTPTPTPAPAPEPAPAPAPTPVPATPPPAPHARAPAQPVPPKVDIAEARAEKERLARARRQAQAQAQAQAEAEAERNRRAQQQQREQAERTAQQQREQAAREKREAAAAAARMEQQREDNLRRMMSQAGTGSGSGSGSAGAPGGVAVRSAGPSAGYRARLAALIRSNLVFADDLPDNPVAEVRVTAAASGTIIARRLVKSSGNAAWDDAVLRAIDKTAKLPHDSDGHVPSELIVSFRPKD